MDKTYHICLCQFVIHAWNEFKGRDTEDTTAFSMSESFKQVSLQYSGGYLHAASSLLTLLVNLSTAGTPGTRLTNLPETWLSGYQDLI